MTYAPGLKLIGPVSDLQSRRILTAPATQFLAALHRTFNKTRLSLLEMRQERWRAIESGNLPDFLPETAAIRNGDWQVGATPPDLQDRRVEITGPAEAKMMINAFNSGSKAFMCDFEDALSPTWSNVLDGQIALQDAVRRTLSYKAPETGKDYRLNDKIATLLVRPRGWHLSERHVLVDNEPLSASFFDFGLAFFHNAQEALARGTGPYFYLPKMESHKEARLWNEVFNFAQDHLKIQRGTIKCTVLIETILAAYEMDEILFELKDHITGLNAGRWDYIFSIIKKFSHDASRLLPDRSQVTMGVPFMRAYADLLVKTCHRRGAHAMGGMAAFIPSRKDPEVNRVAIAKVTEDKQREAAAGFDGTWIAHPDLVAIATPIFDQALAGKPNQKDKPRSDVTIKASELIDVKISGGKISEAGIASNIDVTLQYLDNWVRGVGAVGIHNLMEDAATAEISRAQLWQWLKHQARLDDGRTFTPELYRSIKARELAKSPHIQPSVVALLDSLVLDRNFTEFLTLPAYELLKP